MVTECEYWALSQARPLYLRLRVPTFVCPPIRHLIEELSSVCFNFDNEGKLGKKRRESSKRNYYIISSRVIIKAIIIIWTKRFQQVVSSESKTRRGYEKSKWTKRESSRRKV